MPAFAPDYQVDTLPDLYLDPAQVDRCRKLASQVFQGVYDFIGHHSTVSIERTVLRLFGIAGAGARGVPLCNLMVDRMRAGTTVSLQGAAYWYGRALHAGKRSPSEIIDALPALIASGPLPEAEERTLRDEVRTVKDARHCGPRARGSAAAGGTTCVTDSAPGTPPLKYVIVATGNIHDDVEQARAAAQAGADVIAVIRSTAQSLLDYVPHGATTEGYGGTYATQENFRIMREALDAESQRLGRYVRLTNYSLRTVHARDQAFAGRCRAARHAAQRDAMYVDPVSRHQHEAHHVRSIFQPPHLRFRRHHHQYGRGQLHHDRRRLRGGPHGHRQPVHQ